MFITLPIYQRKDGATIEWTTLGLGPHTRSRRGRNVLKLQEALTSELRDAVGKLAPRELDVFQLARGTQLERVRVELTLKSTGAQRARRKASGLCPLVLEPRWAADDRRFVIAYHPKRQNEPMEWFPVREGEPLAAQATAFLQAAWADLDDEAIGELWSNAHDVVKVISFTAKPKSLLDALEGKPQGVFDDLRGDRAREPGRGLRVLPDIGDNLTLRAAEGRLDLGVVRAAYRDQLRLLLCGERQQPCMVVGPHGSGKTTLLHRAIADMASADGYDAHRNVDRLRAAWRIAGKRIIAGMSHLGDWEQRVVDLLADAKKTRVVLFADDLHHFGRIGRTRDSDRNLAEALRGPLARGEIVLVGECTAEQLRALEEDAPSFASLFARVRVEPTDSAETFRMMVHEMRKLEPHHHVRIEPDALRAVLELGGALLAGTARPGSALDLLRRLARDAAGSRAAPSVVGTANVLALLARTTGFAPQLLDTSAALDADAVEAELASRVMGQPEAIRVAGDLVARIKAGLADPARPFGVFLFAGPTGTGKTELAKAIAEYLFGSDARLVRFDMSELSGWDAAARLVGDRFTPDGLLTRAVREQPFSVVLLDEIEKAHPQVHNLLLQLFDEGRLTDAAGDTASFTSTVIVMTSNLGARARGVGRSRAGFGEEDPEAIAQAHVAAARAFFSPELFNRIDRVVAFRPLTPEVARPVVAKELAKLLARRGLTERHVFVTAHPSIVDRIVRDAFRAADGARSLKRYLEDVVGTLLTEHLVVAPRAAMRLIHLFDAGDRGIALDVEPLSEHDPVNATWALETLAAASADELEAHVAEEARFLEALETGPELERVSIEIREHLVKHSMGHRESADAIYNLETMRAELHAFRERMQQLALSARDADIDTMELELEQERRAVAHVAHEGHVHKYRLFDRRSTIVGAPRPVRGRILEHVAEARFLRRALARVRDAEQHAVFLELVRFGPPPRAAGSLVPASAFGLFEWLADAYRNARGDAQSFAVRTADGALVYGSDEVMWASAMTRGATHVVLKQVGLSVHDFFALEDGSHIRHAMSATPEIVRVRVTPAPASVTAREALERHLANKRAHEDAVSAGTALGAGPEALLAAVRTVHFDAPRRPGALSRVEIEDYAMGTTVSMHARTLEDALTHLWRIRMSREDASA